jgi:hypothetical protein
MVPSGPQVSRARKQAPGFHVRLDEMVQRYGETTNRALESEIAASRVADREEGREELKRLAEKCSALDRRSRRHDERVNSVPGSKTIALQAYIELLEVAVKEQEQRSAQAPLDRKVAALERKQAGLRREMEEIRLRDERMSIKSEVVALEIRHVGLLQRFERWTI